jgi:hypothetical protein
MTITALSSAKLPRTDSATARSPTITSTPVPSFTLTDTIQPTMTFTPTMQPTLTPTPSWTPRPSLPPDQARTFALQVVKTNGGCQLPCWLGITPGKTTWDEVYSFFVTFAKNIYPQVLDSSYTGRVILKFPDLSERGAYLHMDKDGVVTQIETPEDIPLPDLLTTYGPPSEIRIRAIGVVTMSPVGRFTLVLFYPDKGILAVYDGENEKANFIHICPNHIQVPQTAWLLWSPLEKMSFAEAGKETIIRDPPSEADFIPLEKLTGMDIETFYERYKNPANQGICMYIQAPDWP